MGRHPRSLETLFPTKPIRRLSTTNPSTPKTGRNWSVPSVPQQAGPSHCFHLSCFPPPTPLSTFLPDSSGLYLPRCCPHLVSIK